MHFIHGAGFLSARGGECSCPVCLREPKPGLPPGSGTGAAQSVTRSALPPAPGCPAQSLDRKKTLLLRNCLRTYLLLASEQHRSRHRSRRSLETRSVRVNCSPAAPKAASGGRGGSDGGLQGWAAGGIAPLLTLG